MTILTASGRYFSFDAPEDHPFTIEDIASALSKICRFTGNTSHFYSVAQHSVYVSRLCPWHLRLDGLLHDASESVLGDVSSPLKRRLPEYKAIEQSVERVIAYQFGTQYPMPPEIKVADLRMLVTEKAAFMPKTGPDDAVWWPPGQMPEGAPFAIGPMDWQRARDFFLAEYHAIKRNTLGMAGASGDYLPREWFKHITSAWGHE